MRSPLFHVVLADPQTPDPSAIKFAGLTPSFPRSARPFSRAQGPRQFSGRQDTRASSLFCQYCSRPSVTARMFSRAGSISVRCYFVRSDRPMKTGPSIQYLLSNCTTRHAFPIARRPIPPPGRLRSRPRQGTISHCMCAAHTIFAELPTTASS